MEKEWSSWLGSPLLPFKKTEMIQEGMVRKINFPCNGDGGCFRLRTLKCNRPMIGMDFRDTIKGSQKVQMPVAATEFAVRDGFEAAGFFLFYKVKDGLIFGFRECF